MISIIYAFSFMLVFLVIIIYGSTIIGSDGYSCRLLRVRLIVGYIRYNVIELFCVCILSMSRYRSDILSLMDQL